MSAIRMMTSLPAELAAWVRETARQLEISESAVIRLAVRKAKEAK